MSRYPEQPALNFNFERALMSEEETEEMALLRRIQPLFRHEYCAELLRVMLFARYSGSRLMYIDHDVQHFEMVLTCFQHNLDFLRFLLDEIAPLSGKYAQHILILQKVLESYGALDRVGVFEL